MIVSLLLVAGLAATSTPNPARAPTTAAPAKAAPAGSPAPAAAPAAGTAAPQSTPKATTPTTAPGPAAPKGLVTVETRRGKLEFSHKVHAQTACARCHQGQAVPARIGVKGVEAAHKFCVDCHKAGKKGPEKCSWCHKRE